MIQKITMHMRFAIGLFAAAVTGASLGSALRAQQTTTTTTTTTTTAATLASGVYTADQAKRGQTVYAEACSKCHLDDLSGGKDSPPLVGDEFLKGWTGKTVGALFDEVRMTMPFDSPGRLTAEQYADILAYIFSSNKFPAGSQELAHDVAPLQKIPIAK
jgi:mono/diheme cytochrome c family protein